MTHWWELATALSIYAVVLIVPGPNMIVVFNLSMSHARKEAIVSGVGFGIAATCLAIASYVGIGTLKGHVPHLDQIMFLVSGVMLLWFGIRTGAPADLGLGDAGTPSRVPSQLMVFVSSFLLNISNPKALALLAGIYGGPLSVITYLEAAIFMTFCLAFEIVWYYFLTMVFASKLTVKFTVNLISKLMVAAKYLLIGFGVYLISQAFWGWL